jgi:hypothetical protein
MTEKLLDLIDACQNTGSKVDFDALRQAVAEKTGQQLPVEYQYHYPDGSWRCSNGEAINGVKPDCSRALYTKPTQTVNQALAEFELAKWKTQCDQLRAKLAELESEATYLSQFKDTLDDAEEAMFFSIERAARVSFRRWRSSVRGNQVHRGDSYDAHLIWATQQEMKQQPVNQVLLDALKAAHSALIDLHPNYSEKAFYAVLEVHNAIKQSQSTKREPLSDEQFKKNKNQFASSGRF